MQTRFLLRGTFLFLSFWLCTSLKRKTVRFDFLAGSLPFDTEDLAQLLVFDEYMNDVMRYANAEISSGILKCDEVKSAMCATLKADYRLTTQQLDSAKSHLRTALKATEPLSDLKKSGTSVEQTKGGKRRVRLYVEAYCAWLLANDLKQALRIFLTICDEFDSDLFALKRAQLISFLIGDLRSVSQKTGEIITIDKNGETELYTRFDECIRKAAKRHSGQPYIDGLFAFWLEQSSQCTEAWTVVISGLRHFPKDVWLQHALAHALLSSCNPEVVAVKKQRPQFAIQQLAQLASMWKKSDFESVQNEFIRTHLWWHYTVQMIDAHNAFQTALNLFDKHIFALTDTGDVHIDAMLLLWWFEIDHKSNAQNRLDISALLPRFRNVYVYNLKSSKWLLSGYYFYDVLAVYCIATTLQMEVLAEDISDSSANSRGAEYPAADDYFRVLTDLFQRVRLKYDDAISHIITFVACTQLNAHNSDTLRRFQMALGCLPTVESVELVKQQSATGWVLLGGASREQRYILDRFYFKQLIAIRDMDTATAFVNTLSKYMCTESMERMKEELDATQQFLSKAEL